MIFFFINMGILGSSHGSVCTPGLGLPAFSSVEVWLFRKGAASPPNYDTCCIVATTDAFSQGLVSDQLRQKTWEYRTKGRT